MGGPSAARASPVAIGSHRNFCQLFRWWCCRLFFLSEVMLALRQLLSPMGLATASALFLVVLGTPGAALAASTLDSEEASALEELAVDDECVPQQAGADRCALIALQLRSAGVPGIASNATGNETASRSNTTNASVTTKPPPPHPQAGSNVTVTDRPRPPPPPAETISNVTVTDKPPLPPPPPEFGGKVKDSSFISNRKSKSFLWTPATDSMEAALAAAFVGGWPKPFGMQLSSLAKWLNYDLLRSNPFENKGGVVVPWPPSGGDQLGDGGWVGYSRRQVCYITAMSFIGSKTEGYNSGLSRLMSMCRGGGDFRQAFASLLAACAADPTLANGGQGPMLLVAKANAPPSVESVRAVAKEAKLQEAGLRVCDYDTGAPPLAGVPTVPSAGCVPRTSSAPGKDFMTGGLKGQATQDISAAWFGGYLFDAHACGLGGGQDERLSVFFPEVTVLAYFLSSSSPFPQIRQPVWVLGARNFFENLDGTARFDAPLRLAEVPLTGDLVEVEIAGSSYSMSSSRPFLVFMSENQGYLPGGDKSALLPAARRNRAPMQRDVSHGGKHAFEKQVRAWYRSVALTSYSPDVRPALKKLVKSIGAGPWMAGLWWGDGQLGLLAMWLGHSLAAPTWGQPLALDYYMYSDFTENPGNQCFVHSAASCQACMKRCTSPPPGEKAYYMPAAARMNGGPCVNSPQDCGTHGLEHVVSAFKKASAATLWDEIESKLAGGSVDKTVFDELLRK
ncbi:unnamed protein product [Polarella glacialis]|uniref:Poly(ADP-ribose) glycohydrolase n=2 Tax=Polarella glacialis TaxID=89957 RepID=A0A813IT05_POLGL|nr:unnamed protein product [Polarella glacialis]